MFPDILLTLCIYLGYSLALIHSTVLLLGLFPIFFLTLWSVFVNDDKLKTWQSIFPTVLKGSFQMKVIEE